MSVALPSSGFPFPPGGLITCVGTLDIWSRVITVSSPAQLVGEGADEDGMAIVMTVAQWVSLPVRAMPRMHRLLSLGLRH